MPFAERLEAANASHTAACQSEPRHHTKARLRHFWLWCTLQAPRGAVSGYWCGLLGKVRAVAPLQSVVDSPRMAAVCHREVDAIALGEAAVLPPLIVLQDEVCNIEPINQSTLLSANFRLVIYDESGGRVRWLCSPVALQNLRRLPGSEGRR